METYFAQAYDLVVCERRKNLEENVVSEAEDESHVVDVEDEGQRKSAMQLRDTRRRRRGGNVVPLSMRVHT